MLISLATGGSLIPHLPDKFGEIIAHRTSQTLSAEHTVKIDPNTHLAQIVGMPEVPVVSWHHQAVGNIPSGWRIAAKAPDGVTEALEHENHPWAIALQWHPEMSIQDSSQYRIFHAFVTAARTRMGMWRTA